MKRVKLIVAYDGTGYCGWQVQPNEITVEGVLNKHISELTGEDIKVIGASRTDSGVHALGNVAVFDTESRIPGEKMAKALNARLPEDIIIQDSKEVPLDYHPRFQDTRKTYEYTFYNARYDNPVTSRHHHFVYVPLDVEKMKEAASYFLGEHCFISMCSSKAQVTSYVREIYECDVTQNGRYITMRVTGSGFLYNMVRLMAGTLLEVGRGKQEPQWVKEILASKERVTPGPKLPAKGLTLIQIEYPEDRENGFIIFQKLLVLFGFMLIGYLSYKKKWISDDTSSQISGLIVNIFNPALIISGVIGSVGNGNWNLVIMDLILAVILFVVLILISPAFVRILGVKKDERNIYAVMLIFSNLGFMGIPIIEELYGRGAIFYVALYTLVYNILFYTYGIYLFEKERAMQTGQKAKIIFHWKKMINPGMVACLAALLIFAFQIDAPAPAVSFVQYLGNAAIPLSMIITGVSLAKMPLIEVFKDIKMYQFTFLKMLVIPMIAAFAIRLFHLDPVLSGIMVLMFGMPNGSMAVMMAIDYGLDSSICSRGIVLTTLLSIITLPIVAYLI